MNSKSKLLSAVFYLLISIAVVVRENTGISDGPWVGFYEPYWTFWILLTLAAAVFAVSLTVAEISWPVIILNSIFLTTILVSHSLIWNTIWGPSDPWGHLNTIHYDNFGLDANIYPLYHIIIEGLGFITNVPVGRILQLAPYYVPILGLCFAVAVVRRTPGTPTGRRLALIAILGGLFFRFLSRPFSLGMPFLLLIFWSIFQNEWSLRSRILQIFLGISQIFLHPFVAIIAAIVFGSQFVVRVVERRTSLLVNPKPQSILPGLIVSVILGYRLLIAGLASSILYRASYRLTGQEIAAVREGGGGGTAVVTESVSSISKIIEAVIRLSYVLTLSIIGTVTVVSIFRSRKIDYRHATTILAGVTVAGIILTSATLSLGVGIFRVIPIAPILLLPLLAKGLSDRKYLRLFLAVLAISTGFIALVPSSISGGTTISASQPQVNSVDWLVEYRSGYVVGSAQTFTILEARYNNSISIRLSGSNSVIGTWDQKSHNSDYSWGVTNVPNGSLYVVDELDIASAERAAIEGNSFWIQCYNRFKITENQIYDGDDTDYYTLSGEKDTCIERIGLNSS